VSVINSNPSSHILVVDGDDAIRDLNAEVLICSGYQVDTAEDGAAGWESLHAGSYDLLIAADKMPKVSGIDLVKKLRFAGMTLPVVLTSNAVPTEEFDRNSWLQLAATLAKPYTGAQLSETVRAVLLAAEETRNHAADFFPMPAEYLLQITPASQWGINE
jgi:DNA-binding response OmpR family regulator